MEITRRDFIGSTLVGAGASLLNLPSPAAAQGLGGSWTGYGGVGDYRNSNGNTAEVVNSAHRIRDGAYNEGVRNVIDTGESVDVVIVGAGFAGMTAIHEFKKARPSGTCILLDNHPIFGGEAKQNEFDVDGYRLVGPQGSNGFIVPKKEGSAVAGPEAYELWRELGLPDHFEFAELRNGNSSTVFATENYNAMFSDGCATIGYFFQNELTGGQGTWVKNIWEDDLKRAPLPEQIKKDLLKLRDYRHPGGSGHEDREKLGRWLDTMTHGEFLRKVVGVSSDLVRYTDPGVAAGIFGGAMTEMSAFALGGRTVFGLKDWPPYQGFPGGNTTILRHFVKAVFPDAIAGAKQFDAVANGSVNFEALDKKGANLKMRLSATVVRVTHIGDPASAELVEVVYEKGGQLYRIRAKGIVLAIGSWVAKHIARDVSSEYAAALGDIKHGPVLSVNVALHNWRFMDKLAISAARWFEGLGFFANIRRPMQVGSRPAPFNPDKPTLLTFYVPFMKSGIPLEAQLAAARAELFGTSYAQFEQQIISHMERLFAGAGFDAKRDIAGIVLNRWGHALLVPPPGFYFGKDGRSPPLQVLRRRFGRIAFGHSELAGVQSWEHAAVEGTRAIKQVLEVI